MFSFSVRSLPVLLTVVGLLGGMLVSPAAAQIQALPPYTAEPTVPPRPLPAPVDFKPLSRPNVARTADPQSPRDRATTAPAHLASPPAPRIGEYVGSGSLDSEMPLTTWLLGPPVYRPDYPCWQILPDGLMYKSYLAGNQEPRFASVWFYEKDYGWLWDVALGGRVGMLRYGTTDPLTPQGWQLDIEGAAFPRLDLEHGRELVSTDFRFGIPLTHRRGRWQSKFGYYHLSSHLGDEYMVRNNTFNRINYFRDCLVLGVGFFPNPNLRLYAEADWAFTTGGGAKPWEFQFGIDYSPAGPTGLRGTPFFAVNGHIREANDYGGNFTAQTGWQWRGQSGHLMRVGVHYFNGMSDQCQFFDQHEEQIAIALWYDY